MATNCKKPDPEQTAPASSDEVRYTRSVNRRRLLTAIGSGSLLATQKWTTPVINSVVLPSHANMSMFPVGRFGMGSEGTYNIPAQGLEESSIAQRQEAEILDFFIEAAEAANACSTNTCNTGSAANVTIEVVSTIASNPSSSECLQAQVNITPDGSCSSSLLCFDFMADVNGSTVTVAQNCDLKLTNISLVNGQLSGDWSYMSEGSDPAIGSGDFSIDENDASGCDTLGCPA